MDKSLKESVQAEIAIAQHEFRAGNLEAAEARVNRLIAQHPSDPDVLAARGVMEAARGLQEQALASFTAALEGRPHSAETLAWATFVSLNLQRFVEAEELARRFVAAAPRAARSHYLLASALRAQHRIPEALQAADRALAIDPNDTDSLVLKARLLQAWQMPALATELYQKAMAIRPNPGAGIELARMLMRDGHHEAALEIFKQIKPLFPKDDRPYSPMAQAYTLLHRFDEAEVHWAMARQQSGNPTAIAQSQALVEIAAGRFEVAERLLFDLIERDQDVVTSFSILSTGRKMKEVDRPLVEKMAVLSQGALSDGQGIDLNYALGKSFDDLRDYERAMVHYDAANQICRELYQERRSFDPEQSRRFTDYLIDLASPERIEKLSKQGLQEDFPLFVVGMLRSGTTLTETILSGHSNVKAGGEQAFWTERVIDFIYPEGEGDRLGYDHEMVMRFAHDYLRLVDPKAADIRYVVDKNPANVEIASILHTALPNAKFIHLKRHPVDNLLSIWMTPLNANVRYASDRENLVFTYREYVRLWKHWESVLPAERFRTYRYEDLTSSPEVTIPSMLGYLGLEMEEAALSPEKNVRSVLTPSVYQVRQAIHVGSQRRWKNYEPWLGAFAELLDDPDAQ